MSKDASASIKSQKERRPLQIYVLQMTYVWITYNRNILKHSDKKITEDGSQLTDKYIRLVQTLIKGQFPKIGGLQSTLLQER